MKPIRWQPKWGRVPARIVGGVTLAFLLLALQPALLTQSTDRWAGTWATAAVVRPGPPRAPARATRPPQGQTVQRPQGRGGRGNQQLLTFDNQTLRQIVRVSLGGERVRVVLSNAFGTEPLVVSAAHIALRADEAAHCPGVGSRADVQRTSWHDDPAWRRGLQ